jgi:hypothetical protein
LGPWSRVHSFSRPIDDGGRVALRTASRGGLEEDRAVDAVGTDADGSAKGAFDAFLCGLTPGLDEYLGCLPHPAGICYRDIQCIELSCPPS